MISDRLRSQALELLNEMRTLAEASAARVGKDVSKAKPGSRAPAPQDAVFDHWAARLAECTTDRELELQLLLGWRALREIRHYTAKGLRQLDEGEMTERILALAGFDADEVAMLCGPTVRASAVRKTRLRHGMNPQTGRHDPKLAPKDEGRDLALTLHKQDVSIRSIAIRVGVSKSTVQRWLAPVKSNAA